MPTQCVPKNRCNTHAPGWLTGGHPSVVKELSNAVCVFTGVATVVYGLLTFECKIVEPSSLRVIQSSCLQVAFLWRQWLR